MSYLTVTIIDRHMKCLVTEKMASYIVFILLY